MRLARKGLSSTRSPLYSNERTSPVRAVRSEKCQQQILLLAQALRAALDGLPVFAKATSSYLPPREAPFETASKNWLTVSEPLAWLGGYSLNVWRNPPTISTAGTMVQSFSPHHLP